MQLRDIDLNKLEKIPMKLHWGEGNPASERSFFRHEGLIYKIWGEHFDAQDHIIRGDKYVLHQYNNNKSGLALIDIGFITEETCPAFVDLIWDSYNRCRGYVLKEGKLLTSFSEIGQEFIHQMCITSVRTGFFHSDLAPKNLVSVDGKISLIDLDTVPSRIDEIDLDFELRKGSLRPHVIPEYRLFVLDTYLKTVSGEKTLPPEIRRVSSEPVTEKFGNLKMNKVSSGRVPAVESALNKLISSGIKISSVIDIGVLTGTGFLIKAFPKAKHHLFEPVDLFSDTIRSAYRGIDYELYQVAVSSSSGAAFQVAVSADSSSKVTHSHILDEDIAIGERTRQGVVCECKAIEKVRLDDFFSGLPLEDGYLVKIDVDGHEMPIIEGGEQTLSCADIIILEATTGTLVERANAIIRLGFNLLEIVDLCYYYQLLSQVDLIFVNNKITQRFPDLRPWETKEFSFDQWQTFRP